MESGCLGCVPCMPFIVSTGGRWSGLSELSSPLVVCSLPFPRSLALCLSCCLQIWLCFAFTSFLTGFLLFRVCLLGLGALRGLWGFCARVELGGYMACCVFCLSFPFLSFSSLVLLSSCLAFAWLCSKNKDKKSESNSQRLQFNMSGCIPYRRKPPPVRNMRAVLKKASYGTRRVFRSSPCSKQASGVQKGYSVPETPFSGTDKPCVPGKTS